MTGAIAAYVEIGKKRAFAGALDWPGWIRSGRDPESALAALVAAAPRYATVAAAAGHPLPAKAPQVEVRERLPGGAHTEFGVPGAITDADRKPLSRGEAQRQADLVDAAWTYFDRVAAAAPEALRKGPRGGGRDRSAIVDHVIGAEAAYATKLGLKSGALASDDRAAVNAFREAVLEQLRRASTGEPLAERGWPPRYAARRIAWHALDHAWEIEDRSRPAG